uniref:Neur_chan_LBD domain-containing protein n=1 Tax=Rhabditophanes sp. KR3021 TaxID=114890 RepID=A0AC35TGK8_9BILA
MRVVIGLMLVLYLVETKRLRNNGKARSLEVSTTFATPTESTDTNSSFDGEDIFTEAPWTDKQIVEEILKRYRFPDASSNISVSVSMAIDTFLEDKSPHLCSMQVTIKQKWMEHRLAYRNFRDSIHPIKFRSLNYIWSPSLNIDNAVVMTPLGKDDIRIYSNGMLEFEQRYLLSVDSRSNHFNYPFDARNCSIKFSNDDPRASWSYLSNADVGQANQVPSQWIAISWTRGWHSLTILLKRNVQSIFICYYLPTALLTISALFPLFFSAFAKFNRILYGVVVFGATLTLVLHFRHPITPYVKGIDIWAIFVTFYTFICLTESIFITNCASRRLIKPRTMKAKRTKYFDETDERAKWINEAPYYAQLPEPSPLSFVTLLDCIFRIIMVLTILAFFAFYVFCFCVPYWDLK